MDIKVKEMINESIVGIRVETIHLGLSVDYTLVCI